MIGGKEINEFLKTELEGGLYAHISMTAFSGKNFVFYRDLYTVLDGVVYQIGFGKLTPSGDSLLEIKSRCRKIGKYDPQKDYKRTTKEVSYSELRKLLKI